MLREISVSIKKLRKRRLGSSSQKEGKNLHDNVGNFLGTGLYQKYDVNASGGTDKFTAYASFNYTSTDGVVPEDYKNRMVLFKKQLSPPSKWVKNQYH